jgi:hypothetical protein
VLRLDAEAGACLRVACCSERSACQQRVRWRRQRRRPASPDAIQTDEICCGDRVRCRAAALSSVAPRLGASALGGSKGTHAYDCIVYDEKSDLAVLRCVLTK